MHPIWCIWDVYAYHSHVGACIYIDTHMTVHPIYITWGVYGTYMHIIWVSIPHVSDMYNSYITVIYIYSIHITHMSHITHMHMGVYTTCEWYVYTSHIHLMWCIWDEQSYGCLCIYIHPHGNDMHIHPIYTSCGVYGMNIHMGVYTTCEWHMGVWPLWVICIHTP